MANFMDALKALDVEWNRMAVFTDDVTAFVNGPLEADEVVGRVVVTRIFRVFAIIPAGRRCWLNLYGKTNRSLPRGNLAVVTFQIRRRHLQ